MSAIYALIFYLAAFAAVATTALVLLSSNAVYAVLYLVLSLFSVSLVLFSLGAVFLAVLEVLVYAGAIMVLFLFVVMMLNLGSGPAGEDTRRPSRKIFLLPAVFAGLLALLTVAAIVKGAPRPDSTAAYRMDPKEFGRALYERHYLGVELVSLILTIGMVGGMHLGRAAHGFDEDEEIEGGRGGREPARLGPQPSVSPVVRSGGGEEEYSPKTGVESGGAEVHAHAHARAAAGAGVGA